MNHKPLDLTEPVESQTNIEAFAYLGLNSLAYIKGVSFNGSWIYAVHAANGDQLATAPTRELATALVLQNDLIPFDTH